MRFQPGEGEEFVRVTLTEEEAVVLTSACGAWHVLVGSGIYAQEDEAMFERHQAIISLLQTTLRNMTDGGKVMQEYRARAREAVFSGARKALLN